jgi:hypothetical protein
MAQTPKPGEPEFEPRKPASTKISGGGRHGVIALQSLGEIAEAVKEINADYTRHSLAAREIARQFFEAEKVLRSLLERAGI